MNLKQRMAKIFDEEPEQEHDDHEYESLPLRPGTEQSQVYSIRLPVHRIEELRRVASETDERPTAFIRRLVIDELDRRSAGAQILPLFSSVGYVLVIDAAVREAVQGSPHELRVGFKRQLTEELSRVGY